MANITQEFFSRLGILVRINGLLVPLIVFNPSQITTARYSEGVSWQYTQQPTANRVIASNSGFRQPRLMQFIVHSDVSQAGVLGTVALNYIKHDILNSLIARGASFFVIGQGQYLEFALLKKISSVDVDGVDQGIQFQYEFQEQLVADIDFESFTLNAEAQRIADGGAL